MITQSDLEKYDPRGMHNVYDNWSYMAKQSYESEIELIDVDDIDHIVFAGMGGSGTIGDIFSSILSKNNIHVSIVKGYTLPKTVDEQTLVITTSISGNTVETLNVLESATKLGIKTIAFTSGGKMQEFCEKNNMGYRIIPFSHSPRSSFTSFLYSMLKCLGPILPIDKNSVLESIGELEKTSAQISSSNLDESNPSLNLSEWITDIPLIYYPWGLESAAIRFKNSLQENAKTHAIVENVIEGCHNSIVSFEQSSTVKPILLEGIDDFEKTKERWNILKEFFDESNIEYKEIFSVRGNILSKLINLIYVLDYCSIYLALKNRIDPTPVPSIDFIKKRL